MNKLQAALASVVTLFALMGCDGPTARIEGVTIFKRPFPIDGAVPRSGGEQFFLKVDVRLSSNKLFQRDFWSSNTRVTDRFCDAGLSGTVVLDGPRFVGTSEYAVNDLQPSVFLGVFESPKIRYVVEREISPAGGLALDLFEYDAITEPRDICFELESQRATFSNSARTR